MKKTKLLLKVYLKVWINPKLFLGSEPPQLCCLVQFTP